MASIQMRSMALYLLIAHWDPIENT